MHIDALSEISGRYAAILCDIWGVVHNGVRPFQHSVAALREARDKGIAVVLITNAPRSNSAIEGQLAGLGVDPQSWDRIVTSGDVTRELIQSGPRRIFHLGPDRDLEIYDELDIELVEEFEANGVVCTGLFDDETETPDDYADMLRRLRSRNLPFVCANPDIVAERGHKLIWCAGALARDYGQMGGRTLIAGKPFRPIYDLAMRRVADVRGKQTTVAETLAIGDGMLTDVKGAADYGLDYIYVSGGIHAREYGNADSPDLERLSQYLADHGRQPVAIMHRLR
ncbi:MAG: TIGR01459 family HAD-type hydrolase [Rhizobiaceae bacterium]|nr:TIGR01459 family HAD-type hydrolase [Rhizobiaceae bacterium]